MQKDPTRLILNIANIIANCLIAAVGIRILTHAGSDFRSGVIGFYVAAAGIVGVIMEIFDINAIKVYFQFYLLSLGRAGYFLLYAILLSVLQEFHSNVFSCLILVLDCFCSTIKVSS